MARGDALDLGLRTDWLWVGTESEANGGAGGNLEGAKANVTRVRLIIDGGLPIALAGEATFTP